jgi:hypothetical protein
VAYAEYADATDLNAAIAPRRVADSRVMRELLATVKLIAPKNVNVLILGETEAGKELVASLIHGMSKRARAPLVRLNCAGIPRTSRSRSCSGRYAARSAAPTGIGRVSSLRRRAGPWCSTRSASCRCRCSQSSCASVRTVSEAAYEQLLELIVRTDRRSPRTGRCQVFSPFA